MADTYERSAVDRRHGGIMTVMCILDLFHNESQLLLVWLLGGGLVLAVTAASLVVRELLYHRFRNPVEDTVSITEQEEDEHTSIASDHAYVEQLLLNHDGQLHQRYIVTKTGWSKAKVSMLLSDMEADEQLTKIRLGRENLVVLPGHEPEFLPETFNMDKDHS